MSHLFKSVLILALCLLAFGASSPALGSAPQPPSESGADALAAPQAAPFAAVAGSTYIKTFVGHDFRPRSSLCGFEYEAYGAIFANVLDADIENNVFVVNLDLPNGAVVTRVTFYFVDNSATYNISMFLSSYNVSKSYSNWITGSTAEYSSSTAVQNWAWSGSITINSTKSYALRMLPHIATNAHQLYGAQVEYTYAGLALPLVTK